MLWIHIFYYFTSNSFDFGLWSFGSDSCPTSLYSSPVFCLSLPYLNPELEPHLSCLCHHWIQKSGWSAYKSPLYYTCGQTLLLTVQSTYTSAGNQHTNTLPVHWALGSTDWANIANCMANWANSLTVSAAVVVIFSTCSPFLFEFVTSPKHMILYVICMLYFIWKLHILIASLTTHPCTCTTDATGESIIVWSWVGVDKNCHIWLICYESLLEIQYIWLVVGVNAYGFYNYTITAEIILYI